MFILYILEQNDSWSEVINIAMINDICKPLNCNVINVKQFQNHNAYFPRWFISAC